MNTPLCLTNCQISMSNCSINVYAPSELSALYLTQYRETLSQWAVKFRKNCVLIFSPEFSQPFHISAEIHKGENNFMNIEKILSQLKNLDAIKLLQFELENTSEGLIVTLTSQRTNICRKHGKLDGITKTVNGELIKRSVVKTYKYFGLNYTIPWDVDFSGRPSGEFYEMQRLLQTDGYAPNFDYSLRRTGDGALVRYQSSFFLLEDPYGEPGGLRACVSRPEDFEILEQGNLELASR